MSDFDPRKYGPPPSIEDAIRRAKGEGARAIIPASPPEPTPEIVETDPDRLLAAISDLSALIEKSADIGETVALRNRAQAFQFLSRKVELETEIKTRATIAVINAKRKIGELTMALPQSDPFSQSENKGKTELLDEYGLDHNEVYRNEMLAKLDKKRLSLFIDRKISQGYEITVGAAMMYAQNVLKETGKLGKGTQPKGSQPSPGETGVRSMELVIPDELTWKDEYFDFARNILPDDVQTGEVWDIEARRRAGRDR